MSSASRAPMFHRQKEWGIWKHLSHTQINSFASFLSFTDKLLLDGIWGKTASGEKCFIFSSLVDMWEDITVFSTEWWTASCPEGFMSFCWEKIGVFANGMCQVKVNLIVFLIWLLEIFRNYNINILYLCSWHCKHTIRSYGGCTRITIKIIIIVKYLKE